MRKCYSQCGYINHIPTRMGKSLIYEWRIAMNKVLQRNTVLWAMIKQKSKIHRSNAFMKPTEMLQFLSFQKCLPRSRQLKTGRKRAREHFFPNHGAPMHILCGARYQLDITRYWIHYPRVFPILPSRSKPVIFFKPSGFGNK